MHNIRCSKHTKSGGKVQTDCTETQNYSNRLMELVSMERSTIGMNESGEQCAVDPSTANAAKFYGSETILLVDDQIALVQLLETVLTECGYTVISAFDGQHAVEKFKELSDSIDIILMDIIMPRKDGVKAYHEINTIKPDVKVIFMSGFPSDIFGVMNNQIELIVKPFMPFEVVRKIREKLDEPHHCSNFQP